MIVAVLQARATSSRLPNKVLASILGRPMLARQIDRTRRARSLERLVVATSREPSDDPVAELAAACGVGVFRGPLDDVLERVCSAARQLDAEQVVRLTGDCPLADPAVIDVVVDAHLREAADYTSNTLVRTYPDGLDVEVVRFAALAEACAEARLPSEREHVTPFVHRRPDRYHLHPVTRSPDLSALRWTVDVPVDLEVVTEVFRRLLPRDPCFGMADVLRLLRDDPALFAKNAPRVGDRGLVRSLLQDGAFGDSEVRE